MSGGTGPTGATGAAGTAGVYVKTGTFPAVAPFTVTVQCTSATDKALGAGHAALNTGGNGTTLAIEPVNSAGTVIATGTPNGWKFTSTDSNASRTVYITCAP